MLLLVLADRHVRGAVDENVGRHQARIGVEADRDVLAVLAGLFLELGHAVEPAEAGDAIEHPGELGVLGDLALVEDDVFLRVDAAGEERRGHLARRVRQFLRLLPDGDGVHVDDAIDAVVIVLQRHEFRDRAEIIAEVQVAGRLHAGKYPLLERHRLTPRGLWRATSHDRVGRATPDAPEPAGSGTQGLTISKARPFRYSWSETIRIAERAEFDEQRRTDHPAGEGGARHFDRRVFSVVEPRSAEAASASALGRPAGAVAWAFARVRTRQCPTLPRKGQSI